MSHPRRIRTDLQLPTEVAIRKAHAEVENMPADERLTKAGTLLLEAKDLVSDYYDEQLKNVKI